MANSAVIAAGPCWLLDMARATLRVALANDQVSSTWSAVWMARSAASQATSLTRISAASTMQAVSGHQRTEDIDLLFLRC